MKCAAVVAAAGVSSRMREFKPMLCLRDMTMIESVVNNLRSGGVEKIVVVTGYKADALQRHLESLNVQTIENTNFANTKMFDSLCLGLQALEKCYDAVLLTPGDVPLVQPDTIRRIISSGARIARPVCGERLGHPVLLSMELVPRILNYTGEGGLRKAIELLGEAIQDVSVDDAGVAMDADTPEDFKALRRLSMENRSGGQLWPDIHVNIAKGDTILTPETAQFIEMLDHTGSIQSACSCMHMSYSRGWRLLNQMEKDLGYSLVERFPGGASGGGSRLTAKGKRLLTAYQSYKEMVQKSAELLFHQIFSDDLNG